MTLNEFKVIFWWEWAHRFFGRLIGLSFLVPLIYFSVKNPVGFSALNAISVASLSIDVAPLSFFDSIVIIDSIKINGSHVNTEQKGKRLNLDVLRRKLSGEQSVADSNTDINSTKSLPDVAIAKFEFSSASILMKSTHLGQTTLRVPSIIVNDIGRPDKGVSVGECKKDRRSQNLCSSRSLLK